MLNTKQNFHHSKLPELGTVVKLPKKLDPAQSKVIVESYPLCDNILPYSIGIHTVNVRALANNSRHKISGFWLIDQDEY
jgi:hypothetical protein